MMLNGRKPLAKKHVARNGDWYRLILYVHMWTLQNCCMWTKSMDPLNPWFGVTPRSPISPVPAPWCDQSPRWSAILGDVKDCQGATSRECEIPQRTDLFLHIWRFPEMGVPQSSSILIILIGIFPYKPSIWGYPPDYGNPHLSINTHCWF